jgi:hypothetical protein
MKGTEKNLAGPAIVVGIILLATLGAGLTWRNYAADHPSALRAVVLDEKSVSAEFAPDQAPRIRLGSKAIVSHEGVRSTAFVSEVLMDGGQTRFRLSLLQPFTGAPAGAACQVTVDLSIPPELLKGGPPPH